jgi:hypothetical protein
MYSVLAAFDDVSQLCIFYIFKSPFYRCHEFSCGLAVWPRSLLPLRFTAGVLRLLCCVVLSACSIVTEHTRRNWNNYIRSATRKRPTSEHHEIKTRCCSHYEHNLISTTQAQGK